MPHDPLVFLWGVKTAVRPLSPWKGFTYSLVIAVQLAAVNVGTTLQVGFCSDIHALLVCNSRQRDVPASMEMTLRMTFSTLWTGLQRSDADSYMVGSSPGACKIEMHTVPSGYTVEGTDN